MAVGGASQTVCMVSSDDEPTATLEWVEVDSLEPDYAQTILEDFIEDEAQTTLDDFTHMHRRLPSCAYGLGKGSSHRLLARCEQCEGFVPLRFGQASRNGGRSADVCVDAHACAIR